MEVSIQATIDDLNQYLQGNVTAQGLVITLEDLLNFIKDSEGISENKEFDFKKYLAENNLIKEHNPTDVAGEIIELIRSTGVDPSDMMDAIGEEYGISFEFGRG